MIRAMRTAASGMFAQQMQVDALANNISNANTTGFKREALSFRSLLYRTYRHAGGTGGQNQSNPTGLQIGSGVEVSSSHRLQVQGDLELTGRELDISISGNGYFALQMPNGELRYTRDGSFRSDSNGAVVSVDGFLLQPPLTIPPGVTDVTIDQVGIVSGRTEDGGTAQLGEVRLYTFPNNAGLEATGSNLFVETPSSGPAVARQPGDPGTGLLRQGFLERSNVQVVEELIALISAQRNYEVNSRTIRVGDEMLQQISNLIN